MKKLTQCFIAFASLLAFTSNITSVHAAQPMNEQSPNSTPPQLQVKSWLGKEGEPKDNFAVTEQVILHIDVSTPRWFLGPTTIGQIDIPNLIVKQRNQLATNYSERKDGETWSHQRWELTLYPQSSGTFNLPQLPIQATIAGDDGKKTTVSINTSALSFNVLLPSGKLTDKVKWFAATNAKAEQTWQISTSTNTDANADKPDNNGSEPTTVPKVLKVGDAVTRTITLVADDSLSILLPPLLTEQINDHYQAYADPVALDDTSVRGNYQSTRIDKTVYLLQQGGEISFPAVDITWWNTELQQIEVIHLEGQTVNVRHTLQSFVKAYWSWCVVAIVMLLMAIAIIWLIMRYYRTHPTPLVVQFNQALRRRDVSTLRLLLYIKLKRKTGLDVFAQKHELSHIGEQLGQEHGSATWKSFWRGITSNKDKRTSQLRPLALADKIHQI